MRDLLGQKLGKYEILRRLGVGGMGAVYEARDPVLDRRVAIKVFHAAPGNAEFHERFRREGRTLGSLHHPNIVTVYDYGEEEDLLFLVMRLLLGGTLSDRIRERPMPVQEASILLAALGDALDYAHSHKIIHRDVKPSNILFDEAGIPVLTDFGIARMRDSLAGQTQPGFFIGTPTYISPEALGGQVVDHRSDVYSLGVVAYEILTGVPPFAGDALEAVMRGHMFEAPKPLRTLRPELPEALEPIVFKAMAKRPEDRWQTAGEFAQAFRMIGTVKEPRARDFTPAQPQRPFETTPARIAGLAAAVLALVAFGSWLLFRGPTSANPPGGQPPSWWYLRLGAGLLALGIALALTLQYVRRRRKQTSGELRSTSTRRGQLEGGAKSARAAPDAGPHGVMTDAGGASTAAQTTLRLQAPPIDLPGGYPPPKDQAAGPPSLGQPQAPTEVSESTQVIQSPVMSGTAGEPPRLVIPPEETLPSVQLVVTESAEDHLVGRVVKIKRVPLTIGRSGADFCFSEDVAVSRNQAVIDFTEGMYWIRDTGSTNGTFVNGRRIPPGSAEPLLFGSQIRLSPYTCVTFSYEGSQVLPDLSGKLIGGRYRLTRLLRSSVKAAVYSASDSKLPQEVALKILSPHLAAFPGYIEQFEREARLAAQLQHPHICGVIDFGADSVDLGPEGPMRVNYLCMKLLPGGNLAERLSRPEKVSLERIAIWVSRIAEALEYAHRNQVVHRGLKPTSIVFDTEENPYLTDFAIAYSEAGKGTHTVVGAPAYLAPEQWENQPVTSAVDQYALAALTYLMVTGSRPYEGQENPEIRKKNLSRGPAPAHLEAEANGRSDVPRAVSNVMQKALSTDPTGRYPSVLAFAQAFEEAVRGRGVSATAAPRVFISYQRDASAGWAVYFAKELREKYGIDAFLDTQRRDGAVQFPERLRNAIEECDVFVCLLSKKTLTSKWVQEEIHLAYESKRPMVPVFQESYKPPDLSGYLDAHVEALVRSDGVHLLDRRNIHVDHTISDLAMLVKQTAGR